MLVVGWDAEASRGLLPSRCRTTRNEPVRRVLVYLSHVVESTLTINGFWICLEPSIQLVNDASKSLAIRRQALWASKEAAQSARWCSSRLILGRTTAGGFCKALSLGSGFGSGFGDAAFYVLVVAAFLLGDIVVVRLQVNH